MSKPITIFISSAGATNAINVIDALGKTDLQLRLIAGDTDPLAVGIHMAERGYVLPVASDPEFIPRVLEICSKEEVDIILPIYSAELPVFARHRNEIQDRGLRLCVADEATLNLCDDKLRVIEFFDRIGVACPKTWSYEAALNEKLEYPVFLKRRGGSGSKGAMRINSAEDLRYHAAPAMVVQEYLDGKEYTVDIVSDLKGKMIAASPRERVRVYGGLSTRGITVNDDEIIETSRLIVESLGLPGPSNLQCKRTSAGELKYFEVNPRFASGGLPLAVAAGLNIPEILVRLLMSWPLPEIKVRAGVIMNRYWSSQFLQESGGGYETFD
ncbi:MAG TPA: ATP-grasp domain-containing protein [Blastocatellia bacterium]|nr:ATP-grasp domain-containing protein [Blastocatellia bacterium]